MTDFTDTISVKMFVRPELFEEVKGVINVGSFIRVKGVTTIDKFDGELTLGSIVGIKKCDDFTSKRMDASLEKRVELHCHTKMSDMDGVSEVKDIIKRAKKWGMSAIAVTDHGCVQVLPGCQPRPGQGGYLQGHLRGGGVSGGRHQAAGGEFQEPEFCGHLCGFRHRDHGLQPEKNRIIEIGAVKVMDGKITDKFSTFCEPGRADSHLTLRS